MDLAPFSEENFDPKVWINDVFKGQEKKEQHASSLVMRLQLAIQEVNTSLEDTSQQVLSSLPRVVRDVESLGQEASLLKTQMAALMTDLDKVNSSGNCSSLATLVRLDAVKGRLAQSAQALRQADNWTTLLTEAEEVLEAGDLQAAAEKVAQLQRCLSVLSQTPDSEDRAALLHSLQLRIEATASPHVVEAFTHHNLSESIKYSGVLRSVGRGSQARGYYHQCSLAALGGVWAAVLEGDSSSPACLSQYFDHLAQLLHKQLDWVSEVFPDAEARLLLCQLAIAAVQDIEPPIHQVVSSAVKLQEEPLTFLCAVRAAMEDFLTQARHTLGDPPDGRCSLAVQEARSVLTVAVFTPLAQQLTQYGDHERALLCAHLVATDVLRPDVTDTLLQLREYCAKMRTQCVQAVDRCYQVTGLAGCPGLLSGVSGYVAAVVAVLAKARQAVTALRQDITEDWTVFTTCLDLIHGAGVVLVTAEVCEETIGSCLGERQLCWDRPPPPYTLTPASLLQEQQARNLRDTIEQIKDGSSGALTASLDAVRDECRACVSAALQTIASPLQVPLAPLPQLPIWTAHHPTSALSAALAPQEYVTQMGHYLLTLPQHLDPLLVTPSPALNRALQLAHEEFQHPGQRAVSESEVSDADFLIGRVAQATCSLLAEAVLRIPHLQRHAESQLITDIEYIVNILEDLGVSNHQPLDTVLPLLRAAPQDYASVSEGLQGAPIRMVAAIRQMRDISATT